MSSKLTSLSSNPTLREYASGAANQSLSRAAKFVAPIVQVPTLIGRHKIWNPKSRLVIPDTKRALGGKATRIGFTQTDGTYNCEPHALDYAVDNLEKLEGDQIMNVVKEGADIAAQLAGMSHEKTVLAKAKADATAGSTLYAGNASTNVIGIINGHILDVIKGAKGWGAQMVIRILFGATALKLLIDHPTVLARFKMGNKGPMANPGLTDLASLFMAPVETEMSLMVHDENVTLDAESIKFLFDTDILIFGTVPTPTRYDTSFMKTFTLREQTMVPRFYEMEDGRGEVAAFDWTEDVQTTNAGASRLCAVSEASS